ncbi:MAG: hypothetical protein ACREO5_12230, partial [Candidatus Binatia bacterium]
MGEHREAPSPFCFEKPEFSEELATGRDCIPLETKVEMIKDYVIAGQGSLSAFASRSFIKRGPTTARPAREVA